MIPIATLVWVPCPELGIGAECSTVSVPDNHDHAEDGQRSVAVHRAPAPSGPARGQLWLLADGPGRSGIARAQELVDIHEIIAPDLDLLTLDTRGVGFSGRLGCPDEEAEASDDGPALTRSEWGTCADHWQDDRVGLRRYTTTQTALDLVFVVEAAREAGPVYAWAQGYGAYVLDRTMSIVSGDLVDAVLVDGSMPTDWSVADADLTMHQAGRQVAAACDRDPACAGPLGTDAAGLAADLIARVDAGHCAASGLDGNGLQELGAQLLQRGPSEAGQLPALWARLDRCRWSDVRALEHFQAAWGTRSVDAPVLERQILLTDLWDSTTTVEALRAGANNALVSERRSLELARAEWPSTWPGEFHRATPITAVPMLVVHGALDPVVASWRAQARADQFTSPGQRLAVLPGVLGHPVEHSACGQELAAAFLANPEGLLDTTCADREVALPFAADPERDAAWWGASSRYGSAGCATGAGPAGLWIVVWLLARRRRSGWGTQRA